MLLDLFESFADRLEKRLANESRSDPTRHLADAAAAELDASTELLSIDAGLLLHQLVSDPRAWPAQPWDNNFGHPGLTLVDREDFRVDVLYWLQNAASIHKHVSCGAFAAVVGRRLHNAYSFDLTAKLDGDTAAGTLRVNRREMMHELDVCAITPDLTHELFWLEKPAVTISVRCKNHPNGRLEQPADFMPPNLSYIPASFQSTSTVSRWMTGVQLLLRANKDLYRDALGRAMGVADPSYILHVVEDLADIPETDFQGLIAAWDDRREDNVVSQIAQAWPEFRRRRLFSRMYFSNMDTQLLCALLWSGTGGNELRRLLNAEGVDDPEDFVTTHGRQLHAKDERVAPYVNSALESLKY